MPFSLLSPDVMFAITNPLALLGWLILAATPLAPRPALLAGGVVIPLILCIAYALAAATWLPSAEGGFDTLANVQLLFANPGAATTGWIHFLAFDLLVGAWQVRDARTRGIPHLAVFPCLFLTLMLGPVGLLCYLAIRALLSLKGLQT